MMMTARKRVHPLSARILANRMRFQSSSSSPHKRHIPSLESSSEDFSTDSSTSLSERQSHLPTTHSPTSSPSTGPSRKKCRSPSTLVPSTTPTPGSLSHVHINLILPRKRIKGSSVALSPEDIIKGSMEIRSEKEDIDSDIMDDIKANIAAEAVVADEFRVETDVEVEGDDEAEEEAKSSVRGTVEIQIDRVVEPVVFDEVLAPTTDRGSREIVQIGLDVVM
uniref:Uncharacterized protein n=1 Tax=Tanacetum cinerariifolium TaxID=118510 RepID=A0A699J046_TANCI|nr:hypothetical protein [Tanacetum cinerariifolium]